MARTGNAGSADRRSASIPTVVEASGNGERAFDISSRLLRERVVFLGGRWTTIVANL